MNTTKSVGIRYGVIAGLILAVMIFVITPFVTDMKDMEKAGNFGMLGMGIGLSMIFFAIRHVRDKLQGGFITFREAFRTGLTVALIGSLFYVVSWLIYFHFIDNNFIEVYTAQQSAIIESGTGTEAEKAEKLNELNEMMKNYQKLPVMIIYTLMEIFPFAFMITLVCSLLMKRQSA